MKKYTPYEWTLISVANHYGLDKKDYDIRLMWTLEHMDCLEDLVFKAESPAAYMAAVLAVRDTQHSMPSGYLLELDAIASGMQLLAVLTRCKVGMENTGVIDIGERPDPYTKLTINIGSDVKRSIAKDALMTLMK